MTPQSVTTALQVMSDTGAFELTLTSEIVEPGVEHVTLVLESDAAAVPPPVSLQWSEPLLDAVAFWSPWARRFKHLEPSWRVAPVDSRANEGAPVESLISGDGENRLCVAASDAIHPMTISAGVVEETAEVLGRMDLLTSGVPPMQRYEVVLRFDRRPVRYEVALGDVALWWETDCGYGTSIIPEASRVPVYSTWYSFHQRLVAEELLEECRIAAELGCGAVIIDDGWQTLDSNRGYDYAGDWKPERLPEMRRLVEQLHEIGMKVALWYSVPYIGNKTKTFAEWQERLLRQDGQFGSWVFDPRYPSTRQRLVSLLDTAMDEWGLDGFKLDFIERFKLGDIPVAEYTGEARDFHSVEEACVAMLDDLTSAVRDRDPEVLLEFRQRFTGPVMRQFSNMFRVNDCPADVMLNRLSIVDLRMLSRKTTVHSDMLMWHAQETAEAAALQLLAAMFAVPQISVRLANTSDEHMKMLEFWMGFWTAHRETLISEHFRAESPELNYPLITGFSDREQISGAYADFVVPLYADVPELYVMNGRREAGVAVDLPAEWSGANAEIFDCMGNQLNAPSVAGGLQRFPVPPSGLLSITRPSSE